MYYVCNSYIPNWIFDVCVDVGVASGRSLFIIIIYAFILNDFVNPRLFKLGLRFARLKPISYKKPRLIGGSRSRQRACRIVVTVPNLNYVKYGNWFPPLKNYGTLPRFAFSCFVSNCKRRALGQVWSLTYING